MHGSESKKKRWFFSVYIFGDADRELTLSRIFFSPVATETLHKSHPSRQRQVGPSNDRRLFPLDFSCSKSVQKGNASTCFTMSALVSGGTFTRVNVVTPSRTLFIFARSTVLARVGLAGVVI